VRKIVASLESDQDRVETERVQQLNAINQRLATLRTRMDKMYEDKLDGKIDEEFWSRRMNDSREQEREMQAALDRLSEPVTPARVLDAQRTLELANKASFLYLTRNHAERGQLLKTVLLNCATDGVTLTPTYRRPFNMIFERAKRGEWSGREDLNLRPPGPEL
jgi:hypothetical protein